MGTFRILKLFHIPVSHLAPIKPGLHVQNAFPFGFSMHKELLIQSLQVKYVAN